MSEDPHWPRASAWLAGANPPAPGAPTLIVLGAPLSQASISPSGAHETPGAVRAALRGFSTYDADADVDLEAVAITDLGDLPLQNLDNASAQAAVAAAVAGLEHPGDLLVLLGGDNSITRPALVGLAGGRLGRMGLLTLDAHHDVRSFHDGPTNGTPVRGLLEDGLPGAHVVQIGLGTLTNSRAYRTYADEQGITVVSAAQARAEGLAACVAHNLDRLAADCDAIYVDLDVDVLDAAFAPGCPGARPGGLAPWELHAAAFEAGRHPAVRAVDIVEVDATADVGGITVGNAALCLLRAASGLARRT